MLACPNNSWDVLGVLTCRKQNRCAGVPQIVQPIGGQSRLLAERLEVPAREVRVSHGRSRRGREQEPDFRLFTGLRYPAVEGGKHL